MKKFIVTENEKRDIKKLYSLDESLVDDIIDRIEDLYKNKEEKPNKDYSNISTGDVIIVGNLSPQQVDNIKLMIDYMNNSGITDPLAQIGILSVISKESGFVPKSEIPYDTTPNSRIRSIFGNRVAKFSESELDELKKDPKKFFNVVYANSIGNQGGDDGWNYRGRGFNQLTGKNNYRTFGNIIGEDLVGNPDLMNNPEVAAKVAVAFFTKGRPASSFPKFNDKTEAASYFADINAGGSNLHRGKAIAASQNFEVNKNFS